MDFAQHQTITALTRRDITDFITSERVDWSGRLEEVAFLQRVWPALDSMPSTDNRFPNAAGDIWQHRVTNPQDWDEDWIFDDHRFGLRNGTDELFVDFLCQMLHPVVRPNAEEVRRLLTVFNESLERDDWELVEVEQMSGKPVFEGQRREAVKSPTQALELDQYERLGRMSGSSWNFGGDLPGVGQTVTGSVISCRTWSLGAAWRV